MSAEEFAPIVLKAGRDLGVKPKGIIIGFATVDVESTWVMYSNSKVPESMLPKYKGQKVGSDGLSVGLWQQQIVGPPWWWGDVATCMDPYKSSVLFFNRLKALRINIGTDKKPVWIGYEDDRRTPGFYAQAVQGSAFPDRYDKVMVKAGKLYDSLAVPEKVLLIPGVDGLYV